MELARRASRGSGQHADRAAAGVGGPPPRAAHLHRRPRGGRHRLRPRAGRAAPAAHPRPVPQRARTSWAPTLERVVVTELVEHTFYAELHLQVGRRAAHGVSSRPSDAIALAVRTGSPIFAEEGVLDEAGQDAEVEAAEDRGAGRGDPRGVPGLHRAASTPTTSPAADRPRARRPLDPSQRVVTPVRPRLGVV